VEVRLAYRIQEQAYGALSVNVRKMLVEEADAKQSLLGNNRATRALAQRKGPGDDPSP
jgi:hypothetical protein